MRIRRADRSERAALLAVHRNAFGQDEGDEIAQLVDAMLDDATARPLLSLVAEADGRLTGHVLFSAVSVSDNPHISARILAPLAVASEYQRRGIGGALIRDGLRRLTDSGVELVFVLGHPAYYPKFGFRPAGALGLQAPYPIAPENAAAWMVQALAPGIIGNVAGTLQCSDVLGRREYWVE